MATIINNTYFKQQLKLPVDNIDGTTGLQGWINKEEPIILDKILGVELADEFTTALASSPAQKWVDLRDGKVYTDSSGNKQRYKGIQLIIADHVFDAIVSDKQTEATDSGVKNQLVDNADNTSSRSKQIFAQNDMVDRIVHLDGFINKTNSDNPDTYANYLPEVTEKTNIFDL